MPTLPALPALPALVLLMGLCAGPSQAGSALCPGPLPAQGAAVRGPAPVFPADNWWNLDVRGAPVDPRSTEYIAFINNGGVRRLHPDFGGEESPGSVAIYGMPYAVVDASQTKSLVRFVYASESDGTGQAFYPIPTQAITQAHWVEGGAPAAMDQRSRSDRHLLMVDCSRNHLYELYNVWFDGSAWRAGSGAFFDMNTNQRRPEGWTSADAAGLAIFPGLVRHDEVADDTVAEIGHAFRVTVRATNGYVWPASHRAGSTAGALPMGARLRLKALVNGADPVLRTANPQMRKIFRAMQRHGLIVADNGSDLYVTGTFDTRWNNDILNPAFRLLTADDFEVIQLGWNPVGATPGLSALNLGAAQVTAGASATGSVLLTAPAPSGGALVALASSNPIVGVPSSVTVAAGASTATFGLSASAVTVATTVTVTATYANVHRQATIEVQPAPAAAPASLQLQPRQVVGGQTAMATLGLTAPAPAGGLVVALSSSASSWATVPASVMVPAGARSASFTVTTRATSRNRSVTLTARAAGRSVSAALSVLRR